MISERALDRLAGMFRAPDVSGTRYEILSELGRGGMGVVYLARDTALDREVALKIVDGGGGGTRGGMPDALAHEARILARLEHPGIVPVHDFGELPDGRVYYAMKRVRGERLDRWLAAGREPADRLAVFLRACDAIAFAHAHGIVHRDLKPENVMVAEFGEVLVLDWGIAVTNNADCGLRNAECEMLNAEYRAGNAESASPSAFDDSNSVLNDSDSAFRIPHSALQCAAGTLEYMAPEQRDGGVVDRRADIYALGVMLADIGGPPAVAAIADKARAAAADDRYQTVQEMAADVQRFLAGRAVAAHREPILDRLRRIYGRYRVPILLVLTYLAVRMLLLWLARI